MGRFLIFLGVLGFLGLGYRGVVFLDYSFLVDCRGKIFEKRDEVRVGFRGLRVFCEFFIF